MTIFTAVVFLSGWLGNSILSMYIIDGAIDGNQNADIVQQVNAREKSDKSRNDILKFEELEKTLDVELNEDKPSPAARISTEQILVYDDEVVIKIDNPQWAVFTDTNSM